MRVLDLGCHDGFVSAWLRDRYDGDLEIDGLELMPDAADRAVARGINCKVGSAEQAPDLFKPGSYDLVLLFEVIEHVPDVDRLLSAAEAMLKPDGRVYLSTPDGTFGTGNNPHHLRVYRAQDLADLLRRRGSLADMAVGSDGITACSYTPAKRRGDIALYTGPSWMAWSPMDILTKGLGGSETAAVRLAQKLSEQGYVVTVYGECEGTALRDVLYKHWSTFDPLEPREAVICSRMPELFDRPVKARRKLLWVHDVDVQDRLTQQRYDRIDQILVLSEWHERHVKGAYPFAAGKVARIRNGIEHGLFDRPADAPARARRVIYTSSPDRGLDLLLDLWPRVREQVPDAELWHCYAPVYHEIAKQDETVAAHRDRIVELSAQPGVVAIDSFSQPELAKLMMDSLVWCAPSWASSHDMPFHETSCIGAMEAQAAGCLIVASNWGALTETVRVGRLVDGNPHEDRWKDAFVREIVDGLTNAETQQWAQREAPLAVADMGWQGVAESVVAMIDREGALVA